MWQEPWEAGLNQGGANNSIWDCLQFWATVDTTYGIKPSQVHVESFALRLMERQVQYLTDHPALQVRERVMDILHFIKEAQDVGAVDEALWRAFLAAHFGRPSAGTPDEVESAGRFLCAFGQRPTWTWTCVSAAKISRKKAKV